MYEVVFHHNYVCHPIQQFVDLLSLSNISIIILDDECSGYYIHGRALQCAAGQTIYHNFMFSIRRLDGGIRRVRI